VWWSSYHHSQSKEITRSGQYWAFAQFSRFTFAGRPGDLLPKAGAGRGHVAVEHPAVAGVLILTNPALPDRKACRWEKTSRHFTGRELS